MLGVWIAGLTEIKLAGAESAVFPVGVAQVEITPSYPIRLSGYGGRRTASSGVEQRLFAKALAWGDSALGNLSVLLTVDNTGVPAYLTEAVYQRLTAEVPLKREQFALCSSHTHTGPMLKGVLENLFSQDLTAEESATIARYSEELTAKLVEVSLEAIRQPEPSEIWWGQGRAAFARNRRTPDGPVDHDLPILAIKSATGSWRALFVNYACHCTTLGGDFNRHCGDWAGYAQEILERQVRGVRALVAIGCGADSDPHPRGGPIVARQHGQEIADQVQRLLGGTLKPVRALPRGELRRFALAFDTLPTRATWEERSRQPGIVGYHALKNLARLDHGEGLPTELPYSVQTWVFGDDLGMVFLPGEVVVDYARRLKSEFDHRRLWVNAYANDVPCYIPSARIWDEGGYEGGDAMMYYDRPTRLARDTEERIFSQVKAALPASFRATPATSDTPPPQTPAEALRSFHVRPGFEVELVAAEPLVVDPVAVDFGPDGRLWVAEMHDYPAGLDGNFKPGGRISVVTDTDGDGRFDRAVRLVDDVPFPTGVLAWRKGVLVCAAPDIFYLEDTDGDGRPDLRQTLYSGFATHNYQARVNTLRWGLDGWVYGAAGLFGGTIRSHLTGKDHPLSGRDFRIHPDTGEFESVGGLSQQGRVRDDFGNGFGCDNGAWMWHFPFPERYLARNPALTVPDSRVYVAQGPDANRVYPTSHTLERFNDPQSAERTTSACGLEVFRDLRLGAEFYHNAFIAEPVHNLVHRLVVEPAGTTFAGHRAADELQSEFLSSSDNWFRPVETRTGPDGALWVVDMYRFVIEHPRWISPERLAKLDPRAGDQKGRLYRVKRTGDTQRPTWSDLTRQTTAQLVTVLGQDNGVLRDLAHRQLRERADLAAVPGVQALVQGNARPGPRVQALYLLAQLGGLSETLLLQVLRDREPALRQAALVLSESSAPHVEAIRQRWQEMVEDPDPRVRLQLAFSLGERPGTEAGPALGRLALTGASDARMRTAILSSSAQCVPEVLQAVLQLGAEVPGRQALVNELIATSGKTGDAASRAVVLALMVPTLNEAVNDGHLTTVGLLIQAGSLRENAALQPRLERVWSEARRRALDPQESLANRRSALQLLGRGPLSEADLNLLGAALARPESFELAQAALSGLTQSASPRIGQLLLQDWAVKSPTLRAAILDELLNREAWTDPLLTALEAGTVAPRELSATQRQKLARHPNPELARRATTALPNAPDSDRAAVVRAYAAAGELTGVSQRGLAHFQELCSACHAFRGAGQAVGPDLATFREKPLNEFLVAILDPNSVIEPRFLPYEIETRDQRLLTGVIQNETANSLTLVQSGAVRETLLRSDLVSLKPGVYSLMPEGLETALDPQGMADLVAYLRSPSPRGFGSATAESAALARQEFRESAAPGLTRLVFASESLEYRSWLGSSPFRLARQTDGTGRVEWESPPPGDSGAPDSWVRYDVPIGLGFASQPAGGFTLLLNGRKAFDFEVVRGDAHWVSDTLPVRAWYQVRERGEEDGNGLLTLAVQRSALPPGEPVRWTVRAGQAHSQRWFGIYELGATEARTEPTLPGPDAPITVVAATLLNDQVSPADREKLIRDRAQSAAELITAMAQGLGSDSKEEYRRIPWLWQVALPAGRSEDATVLRQVLDAALPAPGDSLHHWQAVVLGGGVINGLSQVRTDPGGRLSQLLEDSAALRARWDRSLALAVTMAADGQVPTGTRYDALRMIALLPWTTARPLLEVHLTAGAHPELQQGAVSGLLDSPEPAAAQLLFERWPQLTPAHQKSVLTGMLRTEAGRRLLNAAVQDQRIPSSALDPATRERLRSKAAGTD